MAVKSGLLCGLVAVTLVACGGTDSNKGNSGGAGGATSGGASSGGTSAGGAPKGGSSAVGSDTPLADFPRVYAAALCRSFERCWTLFSDAAGGIDGCTALVERVATEDIYANLQKAVEAGRVTYHPSELPGCLQALDAASCDEFDQTTCAGLFTGTTATGEACELDEECAGDAQCLVQDSCPGSCGRRASAGQPCTEQNACDAGLKCVTSDDAQTCVNPVKLGESCGPSVPCAGLLYCKASTTATDGTGTCVSRAVGHTGEEGASCDGFGVEPLCEPGLTCSFVQENGESVGRCSPRATSGGACTYSAPDACPEGEYCHIDTELGVKPAAGTCQPQPKLGETCRYGTIWTAPCAETALLCHPDTDVCAVGKHIGETCTAAGECFNGDCTGGQCRSPLECEAALDAM